MGADSRRLSILTAREIDDLYGLPRFTENDRLLYFDLSPAEQEAMDGVHTASAAVHMVLQLGYFKAKRRFFVYEHAAVLEDLHHILRRYFPERDPATVKPLSKPTRLGQQEIVLGLFGYRLCDDAAREELERKAQRMAMLSTQPVYILREALQYLEKQRLVAPGYTFLQDMVGRVVTGERQRLTQLLGKALTPTVERHLDALLEADEGMYRIRALQREPKSFSYKELHQEVQRRGFFKPLYPFSRDFLLTTGLSNESVKYYASLVPFYTVYKLRRMAVATARLYLLCFAHQRFRQINDNLTDAFIHLVDHYEKQAKLASDEAARRAMDEASEHLKSAGQVLNLFIDPSIPADAPFEQVKAKAFSLLKPERFALVSAYMRDVEFDKAACEWAYYRTLSARFKRNLRHLFANLQFAGRVEDAPLMEAVVFLQGLLRGGSSPRRANPAAFPTGVIPKKLRRHLLVETEDSPKKKQLQIDLYEFLLYRLVRNALEAGDLYVADSTEFRRFEDDLIGDTRWQDKAGVLREVGAPILTTPIEETLASLRKELDAKFESVNQNIANGRNKDIKITGAGEKRRWTLACPGAEEANDSPFYSRLPGIGIADLLWFVAGKTGFLDSLTHVLDRYVKYEADARSILACIVAMGTNMGLWKMAEVSGLGHQSLVTAARNYLRIETLHAANDAITNAIATLPMFRQYDIQDELHSSSDGQRIETQIETINARHSSKYFGLKKGVSAYTLVANHVPINARIIGTHEHESHFVFDLLHNNTTDIRPERHSTDTHGTNQVNFWILHVFGYRFAPRYRNLRKKAESLVGFRHPKHYTDCLIKPSRKVLESLVCSEWPNIQRIMASLAQKDVTQATVVRKLGSYARQNRTKKALVELDNICRTLYILDYIDDVVLRQSVQKALNRGEAYHRFRRAIAYVNSGKFRVKTESEQQIWNECSRLIANAVIYYNTALLSRIYAQKKSAGDVTAIDILKHISPIAWQHINLFGRFEFTQTGSRVDLDALAERYNNPDFWSRALREGGLDGQMH
jgi:TnpA family transposase